MTVFRGTSKTQTRESVLSAPMTAIPATKMEAANPATLPLTSDPSIWLPPDAYPSKDTMMIRQPSALNVQQAVNSAPVLLAVCPALTVFFC